MSFFVEFYRLPHAPVITTQGSCVSNLHLLVLGLQELEANDPTQNFFENISYSNTPARPQPKTKMAPEKIAESRRKRRLAQVSGNCDLCFMLLSESPEVRRGPRSPNTLCNRVRSGLQFISCAYRIISLQCGLKYAKQGKNGDINVACPLPAQSIRS